MVYPPLQNVIVHKAVSVVKKQANLASRQDEDSAKFREVSERLQEAEGWQHTCFVRVSGETLVFHSPEGDMYQQGDSHFGPRDCMETFCRIGLEESVWSARAARTRRKTTELLKGEVANRI
jgi:hypothetical protein